MLRKLVHPHIIKIIGTYQEMMSYPRLYFLLMSPVGDSDLEGFLVAAGAQIREAPQWQALQNSLWLKTWFGCLASALAYMHSQGVHHEDIKPKNIIHRGLDIYFTDFSSSREVDLVNQNTSTESPALATRLYAAPEALPDEDGSINRHGSKTDIFSLGLVFVEMLTVLDGKEVGALRENLPNRAPYWKITSTFDDWFVSRTTAHMYTKCIKPMLAQERHARPTALEVVDCIRSHQPWRTLVCPCHHMLGVSEGSTPSQG
jgi:serine/threonine protein kinase